MNLMLNMKDINDMSKWHTLNAKKNDAKKQHIFAETGIYESVGSLPIMPSLLPHVL